MGVGSNNPKRDVGMHLSTPLYITRENYLFLPVVKRELPGYNLVLHYLNVVESLNSSLSKEFIKDVTIPVINSVTLFYSEKEVF